MSGVGRSRPLLVWLSLSLALAATASAQDEDDEELPPAAGAVRVGGFASSLPDTREDGVRAGALAAARAELGRRIRLDLAGARDLGGPAEGADVFAGALHLDAFRVVGGLAGDDAALHVGWAPGGTWRPAEVFSISAGLDASLGAGWLGGRVEPSPDAWGGWRSARAAGLDVLAAGLDAELVLRLEPVERLALEAGAHAGLLLAAGAPRRGAVLPGLEEADAWTDLGLASSLSTAGYGGWGGVAVTVVDHAAGDSRTTVVLGYREAWDLIHDDAAWAIAAHLDPWDDLRLRQPPWRERRTVHATATFARLDGTSLGLRAEAGHVRGATTTAGDPSDLDGWWIGGGAGVALGPGWLEAGVRHHLGEMELERLVGRLARTRAWSRAGVTLHETPATSVGLEAAVEWGGQDDWGLPRRGWSATGALVLAFGGPRSGAAGRLDATSGRGWGHARPPLERRAPPPARASAGASAGSALGAARSAVAAGATVPDSMVPTNEELRRAGLLDGQVTGADIDALVASRPDVASAVETIAPGIVEAAKRLASGEGGAQALSASGAGFLVGSGPGAAGLGLAWPEGTSVAVGLPAEADDGKARILPGFTSQLVGAAPGEGILDLARRQGWQRLTVSRPGHPGRPAWQGTTAWTRSMRAWLGGPSWRDGRLTTSTRD